MSRIYVGCALTYASKESVELVERFKAKLRAMGHEVPDFLGLVSGTAQDVYETDVHDRVANSDAMISFVDEPSTGLGWELGAAVERFRKPTLALAGTQTKVSRLPIGAECARNPHYRFGRYDDVDEALYLAKNFLDK